MHDVGALEGLAAKALAKEISDIRLIIQTPCARIFAIACGYEDADDLDRLRVAPPRFFRRIR
jgi:hypothetical protein